MGHLSGSPVPHRPKRDYPVGKPIQPPPGWRPPVRAPLPAVPAQTASPFRSQLGLVVSAMMIGLLVFVCTTVGWLWSRGARRAKTEVAAAPAKSPPRAPTANPMPRPKDIDGGEDPPRTGMEESGERKKVKEEEEERPAPKPPEDPRPRPRPRPEEAPPPPEAPTLTYEKDILPIMQRSCVNCHGGKKRGGLDLRTLSALVAGGDSGAGVKPGKPNDSPLLDSVVSNRMPPGKARKLTPAEKQLIRDWIASGAKSSRR